MIDRQGNSIHFLRSNSWDWNPQGHCGGGRQEEKPCLNAISDRTGKSGVLGPAQNSSMASYHEHPVVLPHVSHFRQVPLRTRVKLPHSPQASPS
jgi:hypothetical protein